jgi:hypothetical protein
MPQEQLLWYLYLGIPAIIILAGSAWISSKLRM